MRTEEIYIPSLIISGGQTGADMGGLLGARRLGIPTGGVAPKNWYTENGPRPELVNFGLVESESQSYAVRTEQNMEMCDGVLLVAKNFYSTGSNLTRNLAQQYGKPLFEVPMPTISKLESEYLIRDIRQWLSYHEHAFRGISVLNVAGNRESVARGIAQYTQDLIVRIFS